ncbi:MAG: formylmethanofuran dehydrogenase subunit C [Methanomicrobiaceae archaeon]|nr:formylmethanofuran dehydrogenase subunit C [Methanomicrobiaceae archaeon]
MKVTLEVRPRRKPHLPIEAEKIVPRTFFEETDGLSVFRGNKELALEEIFSVAIEGEAASVDGVEITILGDSSRIKRVGEYMDGGRIHVMGDIGMHCGNFMSAGEIVIDGNADAWLGREMRGGTIRCHGSAGDFCAAGYRGEKRGMRGGTVEVFGDAGDFTAETLAGGTVIVHGNAGDLAGVDMKDGVLTIMGDTSMACANMSGGRAYVHGTVYDMIPTFRNIGRETVGGDVFTRFAGDIANRGKGTLFIRNYKYMD